MENSNFFQPAIQPPTISQLLTKIKAGNNVTKNELNDCTTDPRTWKDNDGLTLLNWAVRVRNVNAVKQLLDYSIPDGELSSFEVLFWDRSRENLSKESINSIMNTLIEHTFVKNKGGLKIGSNFPDVSRRKTEDLYRAFNEALRIYDQALTQWIDKPSKNPKVPRKTKQ